MNQEAVYILNRREFKESSLILDVISPNYGRLSIIANGALKSKKGWSALLQVFQPLLMIWTGKSSLKTLVSVDAPSPAISLSGRRLFSAYYLNELLVKLLPQEQYTSTNVSTLFVHYSKALQDLAIVPEIEIPLRELEFHLLADLGVLPDLNYDINGKSIEVASYYQYIPNQGFILAPQINHENQTIDTSFYLGDYLIKLAGLSFDAYENNVFLLQIKRLMRVLIHDLLGGKELKSRVLFQSYQPFRSSK